MLDVSFTLCSLVWGEAAHTGEVRNPHWGHAACIGSGSATHRDQTMPLRLKWLLWRCDKHSALCPYVTDHPKMASAFPCSPLEALWSWSFSPWGISIWFPPPYLHPIVPVPPPLWCAPLSIGCLGAFAINQSQVHRWLHAGICNFSYWSLCLCPADLTLSPLL